MSEGFARLTAALAERYRLERELGQGGMATRSATEVAARRLSLKRRGVTSHPGGRSRAAAAAASTFPERAVRL